MNTILFVCDLDNTLVGDDLALEQLNVHLAAHRQQYGTKIVYATGRSRFLYLQLLQEKSLLFPDALICAVGTEMYFNPTEEESINHQWAEILAWGWHRDTVIEIATHFPNLVPQPISEQGEFKVSYHLKEATTADFVPHLESALAKHRLETTVIYSGGKDLDILPKKANKGLAVQHLQALWQLEQIPVVVCGDSGNDIALYSVPSAKGIIVGNAQPELRQWYEENQNNNLYFAQSSCAGGIMEGLGHFGFI